ncbi:hypothetical protein G9A89_002761 [Geosiphon pyriformis]|nr:hypothetical protein G9A89_002761 [Geosiphon pyriformis]
MNCAYIRFDSKASHNNATKKPLVIGNTLVYWVPIDAKECHFCYQVGHLVSKCPTLHKKKEGNTKKVNNNIRLAKPYVKKNIPEENIKAFGGRLYAEMAVFRMSYNLNNTNSNRIQKSGPQKAEINELRQQVDEMAKLLKGKKEMENKVPSQSTTFKSTLAGKKETYNPELEIKKIKKTLEPILKLLKQKIGTINVRGLNNPSKAKKVLHWVIEEQFDFVIVTETKLTLTKKKSVFFGSDEYHAFWKLSTKKQLGTGVAVAKEIRKLLGDIVQNKKIIIVAGNLNENLLSNSLEETYATNKAKACPTAAILQQINLVDTHRVYATNNPEKTWALNRVQRRLNYVFTNIEMFDVNKSFSTDHKAVVTIIRSDRILASNKKSRSGRKKSNTTIIDVKKASGMQ